ncbi:hypothetical protein WICPIJ_009730 [Wickerhamomyces pijperi]|uniref:Uncharacterized protein n=1 Tax=Wickerhamomyces pijperi TaxID=599730 RepID=A0A9P8PK32_WICPI|nr:hypothetical protein WICPIJ_009730 [Wickerhamomyces pijperi]
MNSLKDGIAISANLATGSTSSTNNTAEGLSLLSQRSSLSIRISGLANIRNTHAVITGTQLFQLTPKLICSQHGVHVMEVLHGTLNDSVVSFEITQADNQYDSLDSQDLNQRPDPLLFVIHILRVFNKQHDTETMRTFPVRHRCEDRTQLQNQSVRVEIGGHHLHCCCCGGGTTTRLLPTNSSGHLDRIQVNEGALIQWQGVGLV